jgi:hypothetical protein
MDIVSTAADVALGHQTSAGHTVSRTIAGVAHLLPAVSFPSFLEHTAHLNEVPAWKSP